MWEPSDVFKQHSESLVFVMALVGLPTCPLFPGLLQESVRTSRLLGLCAIHGLQLYLVGCRGLTVEQRGI